MSQLNELQKRLYAACVQKSRKCFVADCNKPAIASHLLQRRGVLDQLMHEGHLYEVAFRQFPTGRYIISKRGWKEALTFQGFCAAHDASIFAPIEHQQPDFSNYSARLLLSYCALLQEYRVKEIMIDYLGRFREHIKFSAPYAVEDLQTMQAADTLLLWDTEYLLKCVEAELELPKGTFHFTELTLPKVEVCTSVAYSHTSIGETFLTDPPDLKKKLPIAAILLHLIPTDTSTKLILGYHKSAEDRVSDKVAAFAKMDTPQLLNAVSDVLIKSCETWACSENFYLNYVKPKEKNLLASMNYFVRRQQFSSEAPEINLFAQLPP